MSSSDAERGANPLRDLLRGAADQAAAVAENLERAYRGAFVSTETLPGVYRASVVRGDDPAGLGRLQVLVPDAGDQPQWAQVARPLDGGASVPADVGPAVWVAFERGDRSLPVVVGRAAG